MRSVDTEYQTHHLWQIWLPIAAGICALAVATIGLGSKDLWLDEAFSVTSTHQLLESLRQRAGSMGLYYILLTPWSRISINPAWIRLPSVLFAAVAVALTTRLALDYFGRQVAIWSAAVMIPMWGVVRYAQEARAYSLVMLLAVASWSLALRIIDDDTLIRWLGWLICSVALVYSHPIALLVIASQAIWLVLEVSTARELWCRGRLIVLIFGLMLSPIGLATIIGVGAAPDWVPPLGLISLQDLGTMLAGPRLFAQLLMGGAVIITSLLMLLNRNRLPGPDVARSGLLLWLWVPPIVVMLISFSSPTFLGRYFVYILPPVAILLAIGLITITSIQLRTGLGVVLVALLIMGRLDLHHDPGSDWSGAVEFIQQRGLGSDGVLFLSAIYRQPFELAGLAHGGLDDMKPISPTEPWGTLRRYPTLAELSSTLTDHEVLWVIEQSEPVGSTAPPGPLEALDEPLIPLGFCRDTLEKLDGRIMVARFLPCAE